MLLRLIVFFFFLLYQRIVKKKMVDILNFNRENFVTRKYK